MPEMKNTKPRISKVTSNLTSRTALALLTNEIAAYRRLPMPEMVSKAAKILLRLILKVGTFNNRCVTHQE
jgi:hypothetical protein